MTKSLDKPLFDFSGELIPKDKIEEYYKKGIMDIQSMKEYEIYKGELIKENEEASKKRKSANDLIFQEKDPTLFSLGKYKLKDRSE